MTEVEKHLVEALESLTAHYEAREKRLMDVLDEFSKRLSLLEQEWQTWQSEEKSASQQLTKHLKAWDRALKNGTRRSSMLGQELLALSTRLDNMNKR